MMDRVYGAQIEQYFNTKHNMPAAIYDMIDWEALQRATAHRTVQKRILFS